MCGINGIFAYHGSASAPAEREVLATRDHMHARGPDGSGIWWTEDRRCALGHRRLSIIDLSDRAAQPMLSADRKYAITFGGEIYNFPALRAELEADGVRFRTTSDTEALLHLYARHGSQMVHRLRGMFAFAIWDSEKRGLFLARGPYGIKPLYIADDGGTFRFASQVKALLAGGEISHEPDAAGIVGFHLFGSVPEPFTLYRDIRELPAGHTQWIGSSGPRAPQSYVNLAAIIANGHENPIPKAELPERVRTAVLDSVRAHLLSDVEVGVFLSAGIDSGSLLGLMRDAGQRDIRAITLGFEEFSGTGDDEVPLAAEVARRYGAKHIVRRVSKREFRDDLPRILEAMDQPSIDGVNTWFVSKAAKEAGLKVAISGLGGDELFGGYPSFRDMSRWQREFGFLASVPFLGRAARAMIRNFVPGIAEDRPKAAGMLEYAGSLPGAYLLRRGLFLPHELPAMLGPQTTREGLERLGIFHRIAEQLQPDPGSNAGRVCLLETVNYMRNQLLRDADWAGMAHSLEIRTPLADVVLLRDLAGAIPHIGSGLAKATLAGTPSTQLPDAVLERAKTGFSIPRWMFGVESEGAVAKPVRRRGIVSRRWSRIVFGNTEIAEERREPAGSGIFALVSDAFGGFGGISRFNRDFLGALGGSASAGRICILPRVITDPIEESLPDKIAYDRAAAEGKMAFITRAFVSGLRERRIDLVICGHINLLPVAYCVAKARGARVSLVIHGIEAWQRHHNPLVAILARKVDSFVAVSEYSARQFCRWTGVPVERGQIIANCVDLQRFRPQAKNAALAERYGLGSSKVLMTLGRLASEERHKGFDQVLEALPALLRRRDDIKYLIVGDGRDRGRLERKVRDLGLAGNVVFTGRVSEEEKVAHYNLADLYVMPSAGEGFGIVLIEAAACGIPVIGSAADGSSEALLQGRLGTLVNPANSDELVRAIVAALADPAPRTRNALVETFGIEHFRARAQKWLAGELAAAGTPL